MANIVRADQMQHSGSTVCSSLYVWMPRVKTVFSRQLWSVTVCPCKIVCCQQRLCLVGFLTFFTREITFVTSCLLSWAQMPSKQWSTWKHGIALKGSLFFPFRIGSFSEGTGTVAQLINHPLCDWEVVDFIPVRVTRKTVKMVLTSLFSLALSIKKVELELVIRAYV